VTEDGRSCSIRRLGFGDSWQTTQRQHPDGNHVEETSMGKKKKLISRLEKEVGRA
jgi:hypothetical protein